MLSTLCILGIPISGRKNALRIQKIGHAYNGFIPPKIMSVETQDYMNESFFMAFCVYIYIHTHTHTNTHTNTHTHVYIYTHTFSFVQKERRMCVWLIRM